MSNNLNLKVVTLFLNEYIDYDYDAHIRPIRSSEHTVRTYQLIIAAPSGFQLEEVFDRYTPDDDGKLRIVITAYQKPQEEVAP